MLIGWNWYIYMEKELIELLPPTDNNLSTSFMQNMVGGIPSLSCKSIFYLLLVTCWTWLENTNTHFSIVKPSYLNKLSIWHYCAWRAPNISLDKKRPNGVRYHIIFKRVSCASPPWELAPWGRVSIFHLVMTDWIGQNQCYQILWPCHLGVVACAMAVLPMLGSMSSQRPLPTVAAG